MKDTTMWRSTSLLLLFLETLDLAHFADCSLSSVSSKKNPDVDKYEKQFHLNRAAATALSRIHTLLLTVDSDGTLSFDDAESFMTNLQTIISNTEHEQRRNLLILIDGHLTSEKPRGYTIQVIHEFLVSAVNHYEDDKDLHNLVANATSNINEEKKRSFPEPPVSQTIASYLLYPFNAVYDLFTSFLQGQGSGVPKRETFTSLPKPYSDKNYLLGPVFNGTAIGNATAEPEGPQSDEAMFVNGIMDLSHFATINSSQASAAASNVVSGLTGMIVQLLIDLNPNKNTSFERSKVIANAVRNHKSEFGRVGVDIVKYLKSLGGRNPNNSQMSYLLTNTATNISIIMKHVANEALGKSKSQDDQTALEKFDELMDNLAIAVPKISDLIFGKNQHTR